MNEPCPFCKKQPVRWQRTTTQFDKPIAVFFVGCKNKACHIQPSAVTVVSDKFPNGKVARAESDRKWNDRGTSIILL